MAERGIAISHSTILRFRHRSGRTDGCNWKIHFLGDDARMGENKRSRVSAAFYRNEGNRTRRTSKLTAHDQVGFAITSATNPLRIQAIDC
jgi:hypothetical protein